MTYELKDIFSLKLNPLELGMLIALVRADETRNKTGLLQPLDEKLTALIDQIYTDGEQSHLDRLCLDQEPDL